MRMKKNVWNQSGRRMSSPRIRADEARPSLGPDGSGASQWKTEDSRAPQTQQSESNRADANQSAAGRSTFIRGD